MQDSHPLTSQRMSTPHSLVMQSPGNVTASPATKKKVDEGIWASLSKTAKSSFSEEDELPTEADTESHHTPVPATKQLGDNKAAFGIQKSLDAITNSLSFIGDRVGTAIEESLDVISTKAVDFIEGPPPALHKDLKRSPSIGLDGSPVTNQLKASRDVATAMVTKVRQYQRQVEAQKAQLDFATKRCSQLEEENKRLRASLEVQGKMDEDPMVRQQLEALLAEKARLGKENSQLQRENEHLFELLAYSTQGLRSPSVSGTFEWEEDEAGRGTGALGGVPEEDTGVSSREPEGLQGEAESADKSVDDDGHSAGHGRTEEGSESALSARVSELEGKEQGVQLDSSGTAAGVEQLALDK